MSPSFSPNDQSIHPLVMSLVYLIRQWRKKLTGLSVLEVDPELLDITGALDGEELFIRNELHRASGFRKIHLEIARLGAGLQILHCVFFPDPCFDLPIFGLDIVVGSSGVSAAIVDLSPPGNQMPRLILEKLERIPKLSFKETRAFPLWGTIFSPFAYFVRPFDKKEEDSFLLLVNNYLEILFSSLDLIEPDSSQSSITINRFEGQIFYCRQQKRNDKTRIALEKAFNAYWADRYIEELLFDEPLQP